MTKKKSPTQQYQAAKKKIQAKVKQKIIDEPPLNDAEISHRAYFERLVSSGATAEHVQKAWHSYYQGLTNEEKLNVWKEYYESQGSPATTHSLDPSAMRIDPGEISGVIHESAMQASGQSTDNSSFAQVKKKVIRGVSDRAIAARENKHVRALTFAFCTGFLLLFLNFNELFIAQFKSYVSPASQTGTPVIIGSGDGQPVSADPRVIIPKLNVDVPIVFDEGSIDNNKVETALERGVVHYADTPVPGLPGNDVIVGHSSNNLFNSGKYKFAFVLLSKLDKDDTFIINYNAQRFIYRVYDKRIVRPTDVSILGSAAKTYTVTLVTCDPPGTATNRLIVQAEQISPEPNKNATPAVAVTQTPQIVPGNSPSLFQRFRNWILH